MTVHFDVSLSGPLFDGTAPGIAAQMIHAVTEHITETGKDMVGSFSAEFKSHPTWRWETQLTGAVTDNHGRIYDTVPYTAWLEGVASRNQVTRFKGYHMWKISAAWLQQSAGALAETVIATWLPLLGGHGGPAGNPPRPAPPGWPPEAPARPGWVPWDNSRFGPRE